MKTLAMLAVVFVFLTGCGPVNQAIRPTPAEVGRIQRLAVVIHQEGQFTVIDNRAKATDTAVVLFGLTGALIASAYNQHADSEKAKSFSSQLTLSCKPLFLESFKNSLIEYNRFTDAVFLDQNPKPEEAGNYDAVVSFEILNWGLRVAERSQGDLLKPFMEIHAQLIDSKGKKLWDEKDVVVGHGRQSLSSYQSDRELFKKDMEEGMQNAGRKMAVSLIYQ